MKVYCYIDDRGGWGARLNEALERIGLNSQLFRSSDEVEDCRGNLVYMHMDHLQYRVRDKQVASELSHFEHITMVPSPNECYLYDDKYLQYLQLNRWMPYTFHTTSRLRAHMRLYLGRSKLGVPFVSKAKEGASSSNIRFIEDRNEAKEEIQTVFGPEGLPRYDPQKLGLTQQGYVLWQHFIPENQNDWRVIILGQKYAMLAKRFNRKDVPFASGSGEWIAVSDLNDALSKEEDHAGMLSFAHRIAVEHELLFAGFDIVKEPDGTMRILELTQGWAWPGLTRDCRYFKKCELDWEPTAFTGMDQFALMAQMIADGDFHKIAGNAVKGSLDDV